MKVRKYILIAVAVLAGSCARDLGNYEYRELDAPTVSGVDGSYSVLTQERLRISVETAGGLGEDAYDYEWKVIDNNNDNEETIIGTSRDLDYLVVLAPGSYSMYYTLTEKESGIMWRTESELTVSSSMSQGWMVLCSDNGRARLDFISDVTGVTYSDILTSRNVPQMNGPRKIQWLPTLTDESSPYYLLTDDGATRLGQSDFEWEEDYRIMYESAELTQLKPYSISCAGIGKMIVSGDGSGAGNEAYYCEIQGFSGLYGSKVNKNFNVAPTVGGNVLASAIYAAVYLLYDVDAKKFMGYCPLLSLSQLGGHDPLQEMEAMGLIGDSQNESAAVVELEGGFSQWPEGLDFVYMENTEYDPGNASMGVTYTVLADGQKRYVYGVQCGDMLFSYGDCTYVLGKAVYADVSSCTGITSGDNLFAFSSLRNYMYYTSGSAVYRADLSEETVSSELQFELAGETITCLKFNLYHNSDNSLKSYDLVVASTDASGAGILRIYEGYDRVGDFAGAEPAEVYRGADGEEFPEIADVAYKERVY